jgi:ribosomal 50S subunit-recycling heat shock protein
MRIDKFLKVSRIIKRRTVAKEVCDSGKVLINGKPAKPGSEVKVGDIIEIQYAKGNIKAEILDVADHVLKEKAKEQYRIISGKEID